MSEFGVGFGIRVGFMVRDWVNRHAYRLLGA